MAKTLAEYQAEVTRSYEPARQAIQNQINALAGQEAQGLQALQKQYQLDQQTLERNRDTAAEAASLAAAGNGGSFGGQANIANRKYYAQTFAPAKSQLQTNFYKSRGNLSSQIAQNKMSLESQLANLTSEASRYGLSRYDDAVEKDRQHALEQQRLALQRAQIAAQNNYSRYINAAQNQKKATPAQNSFIDYLKSNAAMNYNGWAEGMDDVDKQDYLNDMLRRWQNGDSNTRRQIMGGSTYRHYQSLLGGR